MHANTDVKGIIDLTSDVLEYVIIFYIIIMRLIRRGYDPMAPTYLEGGNAGSF